MNRSLSIPEWHRMAMEGAAPPVRILLNGGSMFPLIRWNRDYVTIAPLKEPPVIGDIVLIAEPDAERYVMHRAWDIRDGKVLTWGDNCPRPDAWLPPDQIWGKAILVERGRRKIKPEPGKGMRWARFWHHARKGYFLYQRIQQGIARRIKKQAT